MFIPYCSFLIIIALWTVNEMWWRGWVYIPALIDWHNYPLPPPNVDVHWKKPDPVPLSERGDKPNIILIMADDMVGTVDQVYILRKVVLNGTSW